MGENNLSKKEKLWLTTVDMGYGHQRTAHPLKCLAFSAQAINANNYEGIPEKDGKVWHSTRNFYELISRFKRVPLIGETAFSLYDKFQKIPNFYPRRDLSKANFSLKNIYSLIESGWGKDLIAKLNKNPMPLVSTFFVPAFMAEFFGFRGEIYCVICDADIARTWAPLYPKESRIKYFAPNSWTVERLKLYGINGKNIFLTGFPLPKENIGGIDQGLLKDDLAFRLLNLDPGNNYRNQFKFLIERNLGILPEMPNHPLTIMFSIGGAGAQKEIAADYLKSLAWKIRRNEIKVILSAGINRSVRDYFLLFLKEVNLESYFGSNIEIIYQDKIGEYFSRFNEKLRKTDILWTKPSELSFYAGLGIPLIIAPSIGSQEDYNRKWLLRVGAGILQEDPKYAVEWIFDYLKDGRFAEAAMQGFNDIEKMGVYNIEKIVFGDRG